MGNVDSVISMQMNNSLCFSRVQRRQLKGPDIHKNEYVEPFLAIESFVESKDDQKLINGQPLQCIQINPVGHMIPGDPTGWVI